MQGTALYGRAPVSAGPRKNAQFGSVHRSALFGRACSGSRRVQRSSRVQSSASAPAETFPAQVCVVLGTQWGDEGKGKLVDILAQQYDVIARAQVGERAHRLWVGRWGVSWVSTRLPSPCAVHCIGSVESNAINGLK
jgi:hypothetical protein